MIAPRRTEPVIPDVEIHITDLVLVCRPGQPLGALATPLARRLAGHGVPDAEAAARAILDRVGREVAS